MKKYSEAVLYYKLDNMILSSSQYLRQVFKSRWKKLTSENWTDSQTQKEKLILSLIPLDSKTKKCPLQAFQQKSLKEKNVGEWDISLLSGILLLQQSSDQNKLDTENEAVRKLKNIRNALAHDDTGSNVNEEEQCSRKCSLVEFEKHAKTFKDCLVCLGVDETTINIIIEKSGVTSSLKALKRAKKLYAVAESLINENQFDQAIDNYTDAISTPSLLPEHKAEAYEKRAACYLKYTKRGNTFCDEALNDATKAITLNGLSWKAHFISAQCYRHKSNFKKAIDGYEHALALSPVQTEVRRELEGCQVLAGILIQNGDVSPEQLPDNLHELIDQFEIETGEKFTEEEYLEYMLKFGALVKGQDQVFRGHQYYYGWGVLQNYNEAVKYYTKADKMGNPIGTYNLGLCYGYGRGVEQNVQKALNTFQRAAAMDPNIEGEQTTMQRNFGVAAAQHAVGTAYNEGIGVDQNYYKAFVWFQKGMENGLSSSAESVGSLYLRGHGVKANDTMAESCWKTAMNWGSHRAAGMLMSYYIMRMEPEKALNMLKLGREMGNLTLLTLKEKELSGVLGEIKRERDAMLPDIVAHEIKHGLSTKGWLFQQRLLRFIKFKDSDFLKNIDAMKQSVKIAMYGEDGGRGVRKIIQDDVIRVLQEKAFNGSQIACKILMAMDYWDELYQELMPIRKYSDAEEIKMVDWLYKSTILQAYLDFPLDYPDGMADFRSLLQKLFEEKCEQIGDQDMKIRLCHVIYNLRGSWRSLTDNFATQVLKEGVRRYPDNVTYYDYLSLSFSFKQNYSEAIYWTKEGLKRHPNDINLLYGLGLHLMHSSNFEEAIKTFHCYLEEAPCDHLKVPQAYYRLSKIYIAQLNTKNEMEKQEIHHLIQTNYVLGENAEKQQLPCYVISGECEQKIFVKCYLNGLNESQDSSVPTQNEDSAQKNTNVAPQETSVLEKKPYLRSPLREALILFHRKKLKEFRTWQNASQMENTAIINMSSTVPPKLKQSVPAKLTGMVPITLNEINPIQDCIFENTFLELTIIEDPNPFYYSIHGVAEDNNGDPTNFYIYNVEKDPESLKKYQIGCKMAILNPYMRIGALNNVNGIRNDEPDCIIHLKKVEDMCRFCGEENATRKCSKCKARYCSRECQRLDWEKFKHKLICSKPN